MGPLTLEQAISKDDLLPEIPVALVGEYNLTRKPSIPLHATLKDVLLPVFPVASIRESITKQTLAPSKQATLKDDFLLELLPVAFDLEYNMNWSPYIPKQATLMDDFLPESPVALVGDYDTKRKPSILEQAGLSQQETVPLMDYDLLWDLPSVLDNEEYYNENEIVGSSSQSSILQKNDILSDDSLQEVLCRKKLRVGGLDLKRGEWECQRCTFCNLAECLIPNCAACSSNPDWRAKLLPPKYHTWDIGQVTCSSE
jgi:hypothetical protein